MVLIKVPELVARRDCSSSAVFKSWFVGTISIVNLIVQGENEDISKSLTNEWIMCERHWLAFNKQNGWECVIDLSRLPSIDHLWLFNHCAIVIWNMSTPYLTWLVIRRSVTKHLTRCPFLTAVDESNDGQEQIQWHCHLRGSSTYSQPINHQLAPIQTKLSLSDSFSYKAM